MNNKPLLVDDKITQEVYEKKKQQILSFIGEAETELRSVNGMLDELSTDESSMIDGLKNLSSKFKICNYCGKKIEELSTICSYCRQILKEEKN